MFVYEGAAKPGGKKEERPTSSGTVTLRLVLPYSQAVDPEKQGEEGKKKEKNSPDDGHGRSPALSLHCARPVTWTKGGEEKKRLSTTRRDVLDFSFFRTPTDA